MKNSSYLMVRSFLFALLLVCGFTSCLKEEVDNTEEVPIEQSVLMSIDVYGKVVDSKNNPLKGVDVLIDGFSTETNEFGIYTFENVKVQGPRVKINFEHAEYFSMYKVVMAEEGLSYKVKATLQSQEASAFVKSDEGGTVALPNQGHVTFAKNSFKRLNGEEYKGDVYVKIQNVNPTSPNIEGEFPSDYSIISANNESKVFTPFACIGVELFTPNNERLQITKPATVHMIIDDKLVEDAPEKTVLGSYDPTKGYWVEEGEAKKVDNYYVAEVSHFSYWCSLVMNNPANLRGYIFEPTSDPEIANFIENVLVKVSLTNGAASGFTRTRNNGGFDIRVPKDEELLVEVFANSFDTECGDPIYSVVLPATTTDYDLGNILVEESDLITVQGNVVNCSDNPLDAGYILMRNQEDDIFVTKIRYDGSFGVSMYACNTEVSLIAYNQDFTKKSEVYVIPNLSTDVMIEELMACQVVDVPPYLLRVITGGDTLIASANSGTKDIVVVDGEIQTLVWTYFDFDIQNTSQDEQKTGGIILRVSGLEQEQCVAKSTEIFIPLKDDQDKTYVFRVQDDIDDTWMQIYNCTSNPEYVHVIGEGVLVKGLSADPVDHRDPKVEFEIYYPLD